MMFACTSNNTADTTQTPAATNSAAASSANNQNNATKGAGAKITTNGNSSVTEVKSGYKNPEQLKDVFTVDKANTLGQQFGKRYCSCVKSKSAGECDEMIKKGIGNMKNVMKANVGRAFDKAFDYAKNNCE